MYFWCSVPFMVVMVALYSQVIPVSSGKYDDGFSAQADVKKRRQRPIGMWTFFTQRH